MTFQRSADGRHQDSSHGLRTHIEASVGDRLPVSAASCEPAPCFEAMSRRAKPITLT
jgi:hypothetical protein